MDMDLTQALRDAAERGTAHRPPVATGPVLQRIHRRRTARIAVESTVGVAAAGAVAVGAVQVTAMRGTDPSPVAPATTSPTPTPTGPDPEWAVVAAADAFRCGEPAPAISDPVGDTDVHLEFRLSGAGDAEPGSGGPVLVTGEPLTVRPALVNGTALPVDAVAGDEPQVWLVRDGTVAGTIASEPSTQPVVEYVAAPGAQVELPVLSGAPVPCDPGSSAPGLGPGTYTVYVVQTVELAEGVAPRVAGAPLTMTITEPEAEDPVSTVPPDDEAAAHPDLDELVASPAGLGPLAVGVPPASNPGAAMIEWDPDHCDPEYFSGGEPGRWVPSGYPEEIVEGAAKPAFHVSADDTSVRWIDVLTPTIRTAEGVGVGTTLADLRTTYPQLEGPFDGPVSRVWWLTGPTGVLAFETQGDGDGLQPAGTPETVVIMRMLERGSDPRFAAANSGQVAGACG